MGHERKISVNYFETEPQLEMRCHSKIFFPFLAQAVSGTILAILVQAMRETFLQNYFGIEP